MADLFDGFRTDGGVSDQSAIVFDGVAFILIDQGAIAAGFPSESRGTIHLCGAIIRMDALCFVRAIRLKAFCNSSLASIVLPRTVEILGSSCSVIANPFHQFRENQIHSYGELNRKHFSIRLSRRSSFRGRLRLSMVRCFPIVKGFSFWLRKAVNIWLLMVTSCRVLIVRF
jgi:hypothetical protein